MPLFDLKLENIGPFHDIEFTFDEQVNLFVGPNNCGKSTVLWALASMTVYPFLFPRKLLREERSAFSADYGGQHHATLDGEFPIARGLLRNDFEEPFWNEERWAKFAKCLKRVGYACFIPALRRGTDFRSKGPSPGDVEATEEGPGKDVVSRHESLVQPEVELKMLQRAAELKKRGRSDDVARLMASLAGTDAMQMKDTEVIQAIIDLDYRSYRERRPEIRKIIEKIGNTVSEITEGFPVEFVGVGEDKDGLFPKFKTCDGEFPLNTLSQGTQSLMQWLGHFLINFAKFYGFPNDLDSRPAVLIIDEIDAHLHPAWQRRILPVLTRTFPRLQIFCSSHSPLMPAGLKAGQVHLLSRNDKNHVVVNRNTKDIDGWSSDEILRGLMGVSEPVDLKTADQLERLQALRRKESLSKKEAAELESLRENVGAKFSRGPATEEILAMAAELGAPAHAKRRNNGNQTRRKAKSDR